MVARNNSVLKSNFKMKMFLPFLVLTFVFWILIKLSKPYSSEVVFNLEYVNLPIEKVFQEQPLSEVSASLNTTGFNLLKYKFTRKSLQIDASNLSYKKEASYYYLPNNHLAEFKLQLSDNPIIERISQDTLFFDLGFNLTKKVPVQLDADIQFKLGYDFMNSFTILPDSVTIVGPQRVLDTLHFVNTQRLDLKEVSTSISTSVELLNYEAMNVTVSSPNVIVTAEVDKFTEGSLIVPFEVRNIPDNVVLTTFPKEIEVFYKVGLKNYSRISKDNLKVICDYQEATDHNLDYLIPQLQEQTSLISSIRFVPSKIEYLIEQ